MYSELRRKDIYNYTFFGVSDEWFIMLFANDSFDHCVPYSSSCVSERRKPWSQKPETSTHVYVLGTVLIRSSKNLPAYHLWLFQITLMKVMSVCGMSGQIKFHFVFSFCIFPRNMWFSLFEQTQHNHNFGFSEVREFPKYYKYTKSLSDSLCVHLFVFVFCSLHI